MSSSLLPSLAGLGLAVSSAAPAPIQVVEGRDVLAVVLIVAAVRREGRGRVARAAVRAAAAQRHGHVGQLGIFAQDEGGELAAHAVHQHAAALVAAVCRR
ncbi:hypothetical protein ON010_g125 [Phytophthora cinnamomi]|nr:hypothetical protein ON010_g125 [Phytophthora cinnamomi]